MQNIKLTTSGYCPHCERETETLRIELEKGNHTIFKCLECGMEPVGETEHADVKQLIKNLKEVILKVKKNFKTTRRE